MTLQRPSFSVTTMREGYDVAEVDELVDLVFKVLALPEPTLSAQQVQHVRFTPVRLRQGYDMGEVDAWLDRAAAVLSGRTGEQVEPTSYTAPSVITDLDTRAGEDSEWTRVLVIVAVAAVVALLFYVSFA